MAEYELFSPESYLEQVYFGYEVDQDSLMWSDGLPENEELQSTPLVFNSAAAVRLGLPAAFYGDTFEESSPFDCTYFQPYFARQIIVSEAYARMVTN